MTSFTLRQRERPQDKKHVWPVRQNTQFTRCYEDALEIVEFGIVFNSGNSWEVVLDGEGSLLVAPFDIQDIATREAGHTLLLNDQYMNEASEPTMCGYGNIGETNEQREDNKSFILSAEPYLNNVEGDDLVFVKVTATKDLEKGKTLGFQSGGKNVLVTNLDGNYHAIGNRCTHKGCLLAKGKLEGNTVRCPCHSSVFDIKTGRVMKGPAKEPEPVYQVKVEGDRIMVDL